MCRHLLLHSSMGYAQLQALYTVRECLGSKWDGLQPAERAELGLRLRILPTRKATVRKTITFLEASKGAMVPESSIRLHFPPALDPPAVRENLELVFL